MDEKMRLNVPYIDKVQLLDNDVLIIKGNWPTPAWKFKKNLYSKDGHTLHVFILGENSGEMTIQVLDPFEYQVSIRELIRAYGDFERIIVHSREGKEHFVQIRKS